MQCFSVDVPRNASVPLSVDEEVLIARVDFWVAMVVTLSLCSLGILGNVFAIAVWQMETAAFNAAIFLFKYMGVWDIVYLGMVIVYNAVRRTAQNQVVLWRTLYHFSNLVHMVSVHVTLLIAFSRWIAITRPLETHTQQSRMLRPKGVYLSCLFLLLYCGMLEAGQLIFSIYCPASNIVYVVKKVVGLALPLLLLLIINISLLWTALRSPRDLQRIQDRTDNSSGKCVRTTQSSSQPAAVPLAEGANKGTAASTEKETCKPSGSLSSGTGAARRDDEEKQQRRLEQEQHEKQQQQQRQQAKTGEPSAQQTARKTPVHRRTYPPINRQASITSGGRHVTMVKAVMLVSLCSFIAYPVGISLQIYAIQDQDLSQLTAHIVINVGVIFQVINSSINVLIYWFFVSRFRKLAAILRRCLCYGD